jgi:hypothetical protein
MQLLTYGRRIPTAELFARIDAVDASTVQRVANKYIYDKDIAISVNFNLLIHLLQNRFPTRISGVQYVWKHRSRRKISREVVHHLQFLD